MRFTVNRSEWKRGEGTSKLLDPVTCKRCVVGFILRELGIPDATYAGKRRIEQMPADVCIEKVRPVLGSAYDSLARGKYRDPELVAELYTYNDRRDLDASYREDYLSKLVAANSPHTLVFVD